jgi:hypothetical protein
MKNIYLVFLTTWACFALTFAKAQTPGAKISGTITDGAKPIDGATVILLAAKDSAVVKTELTNADGSFAFQNLKDNTYIIKVTCIGYKNYRSGVVTVSQQKAVSLPVIILSATTKTLDEVGVTAQKS